eukprot:1687607-Rhodomonas_salina.1
MVPGAFDSARLCSFWRTNLNLPSLPPSIAAQNSTSPLRPFASITSHALPPIRPFQQQHSLPSLPPQQPQQHQH